MEWMRYSGGKRHTYLEGQVLRIDTDVLSDRSCVVSVYPCASPRDSTCQQDPRTLFPDLPASAHPAIIVCMNAAVMFLPRYTARVKNLCSLHMCLVLCDQAVVHLVATGLKSAILMGSSWRRQRMGEIHFQDYYVTRVAVPSGNEHLARFG